MQQLYASLIVIRAGQIPFQEALDLMDQPLPAYAGKIRTPIPFNQKIELRNVNFRYSDHTPYVLEGINLAIRKGSRVGFIGETGSGKSTLIDILMGLLEPTDGSFRIDGLPINSESQQGWQAHIAHVPQAIFLADSTIEENIAFGVPQNQINRKRVRHAAALAQMAETIEAWPNQYLTAVGERGVRLSGGQRQRIGIARALYKHADVIIFDEATSALDGATESKIMEAIAGLSDDITILIVAHRLTTLRNCSSIIELGSGHIKRIGTYPEIIG
jgi:ATP-binding cassette subfamily B protein